MVAIEFYITRSPSCGPNNNLCLDTKFHSSPSPNYPSLHQSAADEYPQIRPYPKPTPSINFKEILSVLGDQDDTKTKESCEDIKPEKLSEPENGK